MDARAIPSIVVAIRDVKRQLQFRLVRLLVEMAVEMSMNLLLLISVGSSSIAQMTGKAKRVPSRPLDF